MSEYIGLAFFICIGAGALMLLFIPLRKSLRYFMWKQVPATLLNSEIVYEVVGRYPMSGRMVASWGHVPKISYQYQVGNDQYESQSIVDPLEETVWFGNQVKAERFIDSVTAGGAMEAFYDPRHPSKSVLLNRLRVADVVGVVAGCTISTIFFYLTILMWPEPVPELDFPLYRNAEVYSYPDEDDQPKYWKMTSADTVDDVTAYYDANVGNGWQSSSSWQPGLSGSVFKVWVRSATESVHREKVTVRVQPETTYVRKGLEVSIGYRNKPLDIHAE